MPAHNDVITKEFGMDEKFWTERYRTGNLGWDIGYVSTPIKEYIDQLDDHGIEILIPGAGNGYEGEYLHQQGFKNTHILDIAQEPLLNFSERVPSFPKQHLHHQDFFVLEGQFDLVFEQTFFCALSPILRTQYVDHMHSLLKPNGKLVGLLFNVPLYDNRPPYGGSRAEYETLFSPRFEIDIMEESVNSIPPRQGSELFIKLTKKG